MKKTLALLLIAVLALSFASCAKNKTNGANSNSVVSQITESETTSTESSETASETESTISNTSSEKKEDSSKVASTSSKNSNNTNTKPESKPETKPESKPSAPAKLNPKTNFKYGKYVAKYLSDDKSLYYKISIYFFEDFEGTQYDRTTYYNKAAATAKLAELGGTFDEADYEENRKVTVGGVVYYDLDLWDNIPEGYEMTDTVIKVKSDYGTSTFSLLADGTIRLETTAKEGRYGKIGTTFTFVPEE